MHGRYRGWTVVGDWIFDNLTEHHPRGYGNWFWGQHPLAGGWNDHQQQCYHMNQDVNIYQ